MAEPKIVNSCTLSRFETCAPLPRLFLQEEPIRERALLGSDFHVTRPEELAEKAASIRLRDTLGEDGFRSVAETRPRVFRSGPALGGAAP